MSVSEEDLALVRDAYAAWTHEGPEAVLPFLADDAEIHDPPEFPDSAVHKGTDAVLARYHQWQEALGEMPVEVLEMISTETEVVVVMNLRAQGPGSGVVLDQEVAHVVRVAGGKLNRQRTFFSRDAALDAAE